MAHYGAILAEFSVENDTHYPISILKKAIQTKMSSYFTIVFSKR